jgi:hypothetical protein
MHRVRLAVVVWSVLLATVSVVVAQSGPPRDLRNAGDHWTAWDPPAVPEGAEVHIIAPGDTLWDLAARFLGDAYLWPQLWERNRYILDAHWIYPGDPLLLGVEVVPADGALTEMMPPEGGEAAGTGADGGVGGTLEAALGGRDFFSGGAFEPLGTPDDIYCSGYIGELEEELPYRLSGSEYDVLAAKLNPNDTGVLRATFGAVGTIKLGLDNGDIVYLNSGLADGLGPGDLLVAVQPGRLIRHPVDEALFGRYYDYLGRVRLLSVQDQTAIGEVVNACKPMPINAGLKRFVPEPVPSERRTAMRPANDPASAEQLEGAPVIVFARDGVVAAGQDTVVFVDAGSGEGLSPGDIFTVYRRGLGSSPPVVLGEVAILSTGEQSSVAKVLASRYPIYIGDLLEPK